MNITRKPDFFIVGAPKCGTTSLYYYLRQHPQIFMPEYKEPHFFGKDLNKLSDEFISDETKYLSLFEDAAPGQIIGEASTFYLYSKSAPGEIEQYNPKAKIIIMLRNPIDFLHSLHSQFLFSGNEDIVDFEEALKLEEERIQGKYLPENIDMLDKVYYKEHVSRIPGQVQNYINIFGRENVTILILEDLQNDPVRCYKKILKMLNVNMEFTPDISIHNPNKVVRSFQIRNIIKRYHIYLGKLRGIFYNKSIGIIRYFIKRNTKEIKRKPIPLDLRIKLNNELKSNIEQLETIINRDLNHWKSFDC